MTEKVYRYTITDGKTMEQAVKEDGLHINHIVLPPGEGFPEHVANATVYMTVMRGTLSIVLDDQEAHAYGRGDILHIPKGTKMAGHNRHGDTLELLIVKLFTE